ncbi:MAG: phosphohydrolase [Burkholderiales bacterium 68-12]|nr:MAG: phosphohydrolase [Burkholderiales bacterium 68-12]
MTDPDQSPDALPVDGAPDDRHYLRAVTDMAERRAVVTQEPIYNLKGMKLVDKGLRVDRQVHDRLRQHQLRQRFDAYLTVENMVTVESVLEVARLHCQTDTLAGLWVYALADERGEDRLLAPVRSMLLPQPLAFMLTVMREQHPALFAHSVRMMLTALFLGIQTGWSDRDCVHLACAALLHDVGALYMDPVWHDPANRITGAGRKQLAAHPVTAMQLIQAQNVYPRSVAQAVLEHHECMDGSGYPRGLPGERISPMGQILLVAEMVAAFFEKYADEAPAQRLSLTLRLNHRKYPAALVACLLPVLQIGVLHKDMRVAQEDVENTIALLSQAFSVWETLSAPLPAQALLPASGQACAFVAERLAALQKTLFEAGSHPQQQAEALPHLRGDAQSLAELALLGREALWQLQHIVDATHSRWPQLAESTDPGDAAVLQWRNTCAARLAAPPGAAP